MRTFRFAPLSLALIAAVGVVDIASRSAAASDASGLAGTLPFRQISGQILLPGRVAQRAVEDMRGVSLRTRQLLDLIAQRGLLRIEQLKAQNASTDDIKAAAQLFVDALDRRASAGLDRISAVESRALARLGDLARSEIQQERVERVARSASKAVSAARDRNIRAVNDAAG